LITIRLEKEKEIGMFQDLTLKTIYALTDAGYAVYMDGDRHLICVEAEE
jgi:hypothetical protein